jgi:hypothetical protein
MKKENQEKEIQEVKFSDLFTVSPDHLLIEFVRESEEYTPGITRLNREVEPYSIVRAIGKSDNNYIKENDYVLTRPGTQLNGFKLYGKELMLIYKHEIQAVISPEVVKEIRKNLNKGIQVEKKIDLVN